MVELQSAYVTLLPSAKGFGAKARAALNKEMAGAGKATGRKLGEDIADEAGKSGKAKARKAGEQVGEELADAAARGGKKGKKKGKKAGQDIGRDIGQGITDGVQSGTRQVPAEGQRAGSRFAATFARASQSRMGTAARSAARDLAVQAGRGAMQGAKDASYGRSRNFVRGMLMGAGRGGATAEGRAAGRSIGRAAADGASEGAADGGKGFGGNFGKAASASLAGSMAGLGPAIAGGLAASGMAVGMQSAVDAASELQQSIGAVDAVFKGSAQSIFEASNRAATDLGLTRNEYNSLASVLGAGLKNKGLKDFAGQTQDLIKIGADLAAQYGGDTQSAVDALASAMRGESDPIERYGISLNETAINAELAAKGQKKLTGAALEQAKAQARISLIAKQSADARGAFKRENATLAGQQQRLRANVDNIKASLGQALIPIATTLTSGIGGAVGKVAVGLGKIDLGVRTFTASFKSGKVAGEGMTRMFSQFGVWVGENLPKAIAFGQQAAAALATTFQLRVLPVLRLLWTIGKSYVLPFLAMIGQRIQTDVLPALGRFGDWVQTRIVPTVREFGQVFVRDVLPAARTFTQNLVTAVLPILQQVGGFIKDDLVPVLGTIASVIIRTVIPVAASLVSAFTTYVLPSLLGLVNVVGTKVLPAVRAVASVFLPVITTLVRLAGVILRTVMPPVIRFAAIGIGGIIQILQLMLRTASWVLSALVGVVKSPVLLVMGWFTRLKNTIGKIPGWFRTARDSVGKLWGGLTAAVSAPITATLRWMQSHFVDPLNKMLEDVGVKFRVPAIYSGAAKSVAGERMFPTGPPKYHVPGVVNRASGGPIPGPWRGPRADNVLGVSDAGVPVARVNPREWIIRVAAAERLRRKRPGLLEHLNRYGDLPGHADGGLVGLPRLAGGGMVYQGMEAWVRKFLPGTAITSRYRPGAVTSSGNRSYHAAGKALDIAPSMDAFNKILGYWRGQIAELIYSPAGNRQIKDGRPHMYSGAVRADHWDHVHWAMRSLDGGDGQSLFGKSVDWLASHAKAIANRLPGGALAGSVAKNVAGRVVSGAVEKARQALSFLGLDGDTPVAGLGDSGGGNGVTRWRSVAQQALSMAGAPTNLTPLLLRRMQVESGGNPAAVNNWDSNARAGTPSRGLMQVIQPTFDAYAGPLRSRGIYDPLANIYAAIRYTQARYHGDFARAWSGTKGYAGGGQVQALRPTLYDTGGVLHPGLTLVSNQTRKPETVRTFAQERQLQDRLTATGDQITFNMVPQDTATELAQQLRFAKSRQANRRRYRQGAGAL